MIHRIDEVLADTQHEQPLPQVSVDLPPFLPELSELQRQQRDRRQARWDYAKATTAEALYGSATVAGAWLTSEFVREGSMGRAAFVFGVTVIADAATGIFDWSRRNEGDDLREIRRKTNTQFKREKRREIRSYDIFLPAHAFKK